MPEAASISATLSGQVVFNRPNRNDTTPLSGTGTEWSLRSATNGTNCGGKATLIAAVEGGYTFTNIFHIRGVNPSESDAEAEIGNNPFYAKAIARHESGTQDNRTYLQFNGTGESGTLTIGTNYMTDLKYTPNRSSDTKGWGMFQITFPEPSTDEVWNWKTNVVIGLQRIEEKKNAAQSYFDAVYRTYTNKWEDPPEFYTPPSCSTPLTSIEAATIQLYNGGAVAERLLNPYGGTNTYRSCWEFSPNNTLGNRWTFVANTNNYVWKIIHDYETH